MSEPQSALAGRSHEGMVSVRDRGLRGMITLRGDLSDKALIKVCTTLTGAKMPGQGRAEFTEDKGLCWMSPDEVLILLPYTEVADGLAAIEKALAQRHHLAVDVSDARAMMTVEGPYAREVIAKLAPVDLHPDSLGPGDFRRTRLGQIAAAFWMSAEERFEVICFRSVADYGFGLLVASAETGAVGHFQQT